MAPLTIEYLWDKLNFQPNQNQINAILYDEGPLFLPAGPGSGKTSVLLWRTLNLIVFKSVLPDDIFLSTFTEKAALRLKEGLRDLLSIASNYSNQSYDLGRMYIGTIHSLCSKIIEDRRFYPNRERNHRPILFDELAQYFFVSNNRNWSSYFKDTSFGDGLDEISFNVNRFFGDFSSSKHNAVVNCISLFNRLSEENVSINYSKEKANSLEFKELLDVYSRYLASLQEDSIITRTDFSLLQSEAYNVLKACPNSGNIFKYIIIDEYQDTNPIQEKLVFELAKGHKNVCVVGDDDQALYRFRGATVENFVRFRTQCQVNLGVKPHIEHLNINYRSREGIVQFYSKFMNSIDWSDPDNDDVIYRVPKDIKAHRLDPNNKSVVVSKPDHPDAVCDEIAVFVKNLLDKEIVQDPNQIAFLFPSLKSIQVDRFKLALEKVGLKVYAPRAGIFLNVDESVDVFGLFLHVFGKPNRGFYPGQDYSNYFNWIDKAFNRGSEIISSDLSLNRFISEKKSEILNVISDYQILLDEINNRGLSLSQPYKVSMKEFLLADIRISSKCRNSLSNEYFERLVNSQSKNKKKVSLKYAITRATSLDWTVLDLFYRFCGFPYFSSAFELAQVGIDEGPICNLSLISKYLSIFTEHYRSLISAESLCNNIFQRFLFGSYLYTLFRLGESEYEDADDPFPLGRIPFITIHQAKGLEFPVVVLGNPNKQKRLQKMENIVSPILSRIGEPLSKIPEFDFMRLFYVALSRAKELLVIPYWSCRGNSVSSPLKQLLNSSFVEKLSNVNFDSIPKSFVDKPDLPSSYSYTRDYLSYKKCPRNYMIFQKYNFIPSRSQTMFFGSLVHQTIDDLHQLIISSREV